MIAKKPAKTQGAALRRPARSPAMTQQDIDALNDCLNQAKTILESHAAHIGPLDRRRLKGVGVKVQGFIDRALALAAENPELLPHYLSFETFRADDQYFAACRALFDLAQQTRELLWNITMQAADAAFTDSLMFYDTSREAARRGLDGAETVSGELSPFYKSRGKRTRTQPTEKELLRDANALLHGKRDGKIVIENVNPKATGGRRKVIDEQFNEE